MKKLFLFSMLIFWPVAFLHATNGTVFVIDKIAPKNAAFTGVVDSSQTVVSTASFSKNLNSTDVDLQTTLQTLDQLNVAGNAAASALGITTGTAGAFTGPVISTPTRLVVFDSTTFIVNSVGIATAAVTLTNVMTFSSATANFLSLSSAPATYVNQNTFATTTSTGVLTSTDWNTFNGKGVGTLTFIIAGPGLSGGGAGPTVTVQVSSVSLSTQTFGNLQTANLNSGLNANATSFWRGDGTWAGIPVNGNAAILPVFNGSNLISSPTVSIAADSSTINTYLIGTSSAGFRVNQASVTVQGNTFNAANKLALFTAGAQYPALDGNLITNINGGNVTGTLPVGVLPTNSNAYIQAQNSSVQQSSFSALIGTLQYLNVTSSATVISTMTAAYFIGNGGGLTNLPSSALSPGSTNYIQNTNSLQSNSTSYADYVIVGTRLTLPHSGTVAFIHSPAGGKVFIDDYSNTNIEIGENMQSVPGASNTLMNMGSNLFSGTQDTYYGASAGFNDSGSENTGIGGNAGYSNTAGTNNLFAGWYGGGSNTTGSQNTYLNNNATSNVYNRTGSNNTFIGFNSGLAANTNQNKRIGLGYNAIPNCDNCGVIGDPADSSFMLGIGTGNPRGTLDVYGTMFVQSTFTVVTGTISINGTTYKWQAGTGGSGQFLQNNNGTITSATPSGGGSGGYALEPATVTIKVATMTAPSGYPSILISTAMNVNSGSSQPNILTNGVQVASITALGSNGVSVQGATCTVVQTAGNIGEYVSSKTASATNFPTTTQYGDLVSMSLSSGAWMVTFAACDVLSGATITDGAQIGISTTSGNSTVGLVDGDSRIQFGSFSGTNNNCNSVPNYLMTFNVTTTVYAKFEEAYSVGQPKMSGRLSAIRSY